MVRVVTKGKKSWKHSPKHYGAVIQSRKQKSNLIASNIGKTKSIKRWRVATPCWMNAIDWIASLIR